MLVVLTSDFHFSEVQFISYAQKQRMNRAVLFYLKDLANNHITKVLYGKKLF